MQYLVEELREVQVDAHQREALAATIGRIESFPPSADWMLILLATCNQEHVIFQKDWRPPREERQQAPVGTLANIGGFFDGLPMTENRGSRVKLRIKADGTEAYRLEQMRQRQSILQRRIQSQE